MQLACTPLPRPPSKKQRAKILASIVFNFPGTTVISEQRKPLGYAIFWGVNKVYYERCATSNSQQQSHSWFPQLIVVLWLLVEIRQNFLTVGI